MSAYSHRGVVYFVAAGEYVKIGYSAGNLDRRMEAMFSGRILRPDDIDESRPPQVFFTIPGCIVRDERRIHGLFARHHVIGEWYRFDLAFVRHLNSLEYVTDAEVLLRLRRARAELKKVGPDRFGAHLRATPEAA